VSNILLPGTTSFMQLHSVKSNEKLKMQKEELTRQTFESNKFKDTKWVIKSRNLKERQYNGHQKTLHRK
jgi:hypothetical protein